MPARKPLEKKKKKKAKSSGDTFTSSLSSSSSRSLNETEEDGGKAASGSKEEDEGKKGKAAFSSTMGKKKQKSQQKFFFASSSSFCKDPLSLSRNTGKGGGGGGGGGGRSSLSTEREKEEFVDFLLSKQSSEEGGGGEDDDGDGFTLQCPMQVVREAVREYPGVKLNRELLEDAEAALAFFGGGREGGGSFNIDEDGDGEGLNSSSSSTHVLRVRHNFLMMEDFEEMVEDSSGARTVLLTIPSSSISSKEEDVATKKTVFLNALKISEQNREIGEREEEARRENLLEVKKKLVSQANTAAAAKGKTSSSGGVGKKKTGTKGGGGAAATKRKKEDDAGDLKIGGKDEEEGVEKEKNIDGILFDDNDILSGSCAATRRFNTGKFQLEQSKKSHGAVANDKVFKFLREFKKEIYDVYRLRSLVEKMDLSSDNNDSVDVIDQKRDDRENVLQCIRIWIEMRGMVVSARLALIEREKFLKDCEAMTKFASEYRKDTKNVTSALASSSALADQTTTTVIAPLKTKAADARTAKTILKEIPTYSIANRSLSSWSILFNEDDEALLDNGCVERSDDIDDDIDDYVDDDVDDDVQHVLTIEEQLENEIETYEQDQKFHQLIMKDYFRHVTPAGREFREVTAKLEKALEKVLRSPTLRTKTLHDRDRLLASTKWSADQTMVFDDLVLLCDNAHFPSNEKACKAADDINRHVLYRAGSVLKKAFEILSSFVEKDLLDGELKKSASQLFSSTLEQTYRHQFGNILNDILDPYDSLPDYTGETSKLLMFVRVRVTRAMEIDSALRERAHQTVISACLEQMLSGIFDEFSRQKTEKFIEQLLFEEETEEKEKKKAKAAKASSSSSSKKKKSNKTVKETPVPSFSEKRDKVSDKEEDEEEEKEDEEEEKKEEVTPALPHVAPTIAARDEGECMEEENLEAWQEVKKARSAKSSPSSVIVGPKDLVVSKVKVSPVKKIPTAKQQQQQQERRNELSSSPPLPKSPPPKEVVSAAVEKKREATRRVLFVDKLKKNEMAPAPVVVVEEKTSEEKKEGDEVREANEGKKEETNVDADDKEENENAYVVRNVSDIEQSFCAASNPPPIQQQHYQHHHHQHYQPPLPQMPPPQMVDGQRVVFVPMIIPDSGSMSHPMPFGMHHHHSMVPPLPPPMPQLPDTSEAVAAMYNKFYQDFMMQQQYAQPPPPPRKSSSSNIAGGANEVTSDTASTSSDELSSAAAVKFSSTPSSPPLPKTPPPKGQQQMVAKHHHKSTSSSSSPSMSPSASSSSIRIPSPRRIDPAQISSSAFPKPRRSSREYKRDNYHHHHHRGNNTINHNTNLKKEEDFPELSPSIAKDKNTKASNAMSLAKSNKSWAEAQMELKGTSLPSLTSSPVKPPSPPQRHHQVQRQVA